MFAVNEVDYSIEELEIRLTSLAQHGLCRLWAGLRIAVAAADAFEWLCLLLYCRDIDAQVVPIHPDTPRTTAELKARQLGCHYLVWQSCTTILELGRERPPAPGALLQFSSGTTGEPKLITRPWADIGREIDNYNRRLAMTPEVTPVVACPVTHAYGLICGFLASLARGVRPHLVTGLNARYLLDVINRYRQPLVYSSPQFIRSLLELLPATQRLHAVMTSGTLLPESWFENLKSRSEIVLQQYGCSQAGCISIAHQPVAANDLGLPLDRWQIGTGTREDPAEIRVTDGECIIATQDLGYLDECGHLRFCGRLDDTIVVSGFNVYPAEVENVLLRHPEIDDVVIFKTGEIGSEKVAALYASSRELAAGELRRWCQQHLPRYQWPALFRRCRQIPRMANGKISRRQLAAESEAVGEVV